MRTDRIDWRFVLPIFSGAGLQLASACLFLRGEPATSSLALMISGVVLWVFGALLRKGSGIWLLLLLPLVFPIIGPVLFCLGMTGYFFYGQTEGIFDLAEFSEYKDHLVLPGDHLLHRATLERVRKLQPAGDILKGQDVPLKQSVLAIIGQDPSENVVRLLQGAKNDPDDEVRMIASILLTRVEKSYMESIIRSEKDQGTEDRDLSAGRACLSYADSGLPVQNLRERAIRESLVHFQRAIESGAVLETDLLSRLFMESVRHRNQPLEELTREELEKRGGQHSRTMNEFIRLFENREFRKLSGKLSERTGGQVGEWFERLREWEEGRQP